MAKGLIMKIVPWVLIPVFSLVTSITTYNLAYNSCERMNKPVSIKSYVPPNCTVTFENEFGNESSFVKTKEGNYIPYEMGEVEPSRTLLRDCKRN